MKKVITIAAAMLLGAAAFGQENIGVTIDLGWGIEPYKYDAGEYNPESLSGITAAASYEYRFINLLGVSAGARFDYVGLGDFSENSFYKTTWKRAYIDVPVKLNLHLGGFYLNAGPVAKFLVTAKTTETSKTTGVSVTTNTLKDYPDMLNTAQFALEAGLGYVFRSGFKLFFNYGYNFTNYMKTIPEESDVKDIKTSLISFGVGFSF